MHPAGTVVKRSGSRFGLADFLFLLRRRVGYTVAFDLAGRIFIQEIAGAQKTAPVYYTINRICRTRVPIEIPAMISSENNMVVVITKAPRKLNIQLR